ncbi:hypothetical protein B0H14DRAFT_3854898, partial [Mycena olivaceomarginata]
LGLGSGGGVLFLRANVLLQNVPLRRSSCAFIPCAPPCAFYRFAANAFHPRCLPLDVPPATSSTPTQPRLSLQIPPRAVAPGGLALPVPVQGVDTPLCDATGAGWCDAAPAAAAAIGSAKPGVGAAECAWRCAGTH